MFAAWRSENSVGIPGAGQRQLQNTLEGLAMAVDRLRESHKMEDNCLSFVAISETTMWLYVLDRRFSSSGSYSTSRRTDPGGQAILGLRHIWNALKHGDLDDVVDFTRGAAWPMGRGPPVGFNLTGNPMTPSPHFPSSPSKGSPHTRNISLGDPRSTLWSKPSSSSRKGPSPSASNGTENRLPLLRPILRERRSHAPRATASVAPSPRRVP